MANVTLEKDEQRRPKPAARDGEYGKRYKGFDVNAWKEKFNAGTNGWPPPRPDDGDAYYAMLVTETEDMRNAGNSIVSELYLKGWWIPDDEDFRCATPDGNTFYMIRPWSEVMSERAKNNKIALANEGFKETPENVKEIEITRTMEPITIDDVRAWENDNKVKGE